MAVPVARVHLAVAHAALPALLPTPPKSKMLPLLATPCVLILPMSPPKASRADVSEDVSKSTTKPPSKPCRADAVERWDAHKIRPASRPSSPFSSQSSSSSGKSSSSGRASCSNSPLTSRASSSAARWDSNKKAINIRASSAGCRDVHKKPRPPLADELYGSDSSTGSNDMELDMPQAQQQAMYAGPCFFASPDPSMLPMPKFLVRATPA